MIITISKYRGGRSNLRANYSAGVYVRTVNRTYYMYRSIGRGIASRSRDRRTDKERAINSANTPLYIALNESAVVRSPMLFPVATDRG